MMNDQYWGSGLLVTVLKSPTIVCTALQAQCTTESQQINHSVVVAKGHAQTANFNMGQSFLRGNILNFISRLFPEAKDTTTRLCMYTVIVQQSYMVRENLASRLTVCRKLIIS